MRLHSYSDTRIIDEFGELSEQKRDVEARLKVLRDEIIVRGILHAIGEHYMIQVAKGQQTRLDVEKIRGTMGENWIKAFEKTSETVTVRANRVPRKAVA